MAFNPSSIFTSLIGLFGSHSAANMQLRNNRDIADRQNQFNLQQWARENDYNTPLAQMQRYQNAGLNPSLIYGQQNLSAQSPTLTGGAPMDYAPFVQSGLQSMMIGAQIENLRADSENKRADAESKDANTKLLNEQSKLVFQQVRKLTEETNFFFNPLVRQAVVTSVGEDGQEFTKISEFVSSNFEKRFERELSLMDTDFADKQARLVMTQVESWIKEQMFAYLKDPKNSQTLPEYFEAIYNSPKLQNADTEASKAMKLAAAALSGNESLLLQAQTELTKVNADIQTLTKETLEVIPPEVRGALLIAQSVLSSLTDVANSASNFLPKGKKK